MKKTESNNITNIASVVIFAATLIVIFFGWIWLVIIIIGVVIVIVLIGTKVITFDNTSTPLPKRINKKINANVTKISKNKAKWVGKSQQTIIAGKQVDGYVYVGGRLNPVVKNTSISYGCEFDAALINPSATVDFANPDYDGYNLKYWPNYSEIAPSSRAAYLIWLANGKSDKKIKIGYVFLYFYGIERRLFYDSDIDIEAQEPLDLINELIRLYAIYAENSKSFRNYCSNLICQAFIRYYPANIDDIPENILDAFNFKISPIVKYIFAEFAKNQIPIPGKWALALVTCHPEISLKMPAKRCPSEFKSLFLMLYKDKYNDGLIIKECKKKLNIDYQPASPTLQQLSNAMQIPIGYTDVSELKGTVNRFNSILEQCYELLNPYSRFLGRSPDLVNTLEAILLLPPQLISTGDPRIRKLKEKLIDNEMRERGLRSIKFNKLCEILGVSSNSNLSSKAIRDISSSLMSLGLGFSPDYDLTGIKADIDSKIVIYQIDRSKPDIESERHVIQRIMLFLRLGMLMAAADGNISSEEIEFLTTLIEENNLSENSRMRLWGFLEFILNNKLSNMTLQKNIQNLSLVHKNLLAKKMTEMVKADGKIAKSEIAQLGKIFKMLGLDSKEAITSLHRSESAEYDPITVVEKTEHKEYKIHEPVQELKKNKVVIDYGKVALKEKETEEVLSVLDEVFRDEDDFYEETRKADGIDINLDVEHKKLLDFLISKSEWPRSEIEEFCKPLQLMVDGAMEIINEYIINKYQEPLLEGDDPIYVEIDLVQEMKND